MLLDKQAHITPYRGMPIELVATGEKVSPIVGDSVVLYYFNNGTLTLDAWQAAWVLVTGKLSTWQIKNVIGSWLATDNNSSLAVTSTALTTLVNSTPATFEATDGLTLKETLIQVADRLTNGQYIVDYQRGVIYGKKADTSVSVLATYSVWAASASSIALNTYATRPAGILTTGYVDGTIISGAEIYDQLVVYVDFTKWSLTSAELKLEFSADWTNYYQETFSAIVAATDTMSLGAHTMTASGAYRYATPIKDKYIKISIKGTGTVTGSSAKITTVLGNS